MITPSKNDARFLLLCVLYLYLYVMNKKKKKIRPWKLIKILKTMYLLSVLTEE